MAQGMPDPKTTVANVGASVGRIDAMDASMAKKPAAKPAAKPEAEEDDTPITADKAAAGLARAKANEAALAKAAGAPKPPGVLDKLKAIVGVK